jgi:hypothetical protein
MSAVDTASWVGEYFTEQTRSFKDRSLRSVCTLLDLVKKRYRIALKRSVLWSAAEELWSGKLGSLQWEQSDLWDNVRQALQHFASKGSSYSRFDIDLQENKRVYLDSCDRQMCLYCLRDLNVQLEEQERSIQDFLLQRPVSAPPYRDESGAISTYAQTTYTVRLIEFESALSRTKTIERLKKAWPNRMHRFSESTSGDRNDITISHSVNDASQDLENNFYEAKSRFAKSYSELSWKKK